MRAYIIIFNLISPFMLICQNQYYPNLRHDNTWIFGKGSWGNSFMTFDSNKIQLKKIKPTLLGMSYCTATMRDTDGKLLFFTNGVSIMNKEFKIIKNGNRINPGPFMELYNWTGEGLPMPQGTLALSFPTNDSIYQLLHLDMWSKSKNNTLQNYSPFYYSTINMKMNNGLGEVINLNKPVNIDDTLSVGQLTACRHANGRDWWALLKKPYERIYKSYLVTETLVEYKFDNLIQIQTDTFNEPYGQSMFTPDGTKFISVSGPRLKKPAYFDLYDFDRCSGVISSHQRIQFEDSLYHIVIGGAVSPNSKYLYVSRYDYILQFDLEAPNILATIDTVAKYDGSTSPVTGCKNTFFLSQLAPDGKIYVSVGPCATEYLTVIEEPDKKGKACNVNQHAIYLEVNNSFAVPNFPNYKLGALKGSGCDTLTVSNKEIVNNYLVKIFPNPSTEQILVDITLPNYDPTTKTEVILVDVSGEIVQQYTMPDFAYKATLDISKLAGGVYGVQLRQRNKVLAVEKLVVVR